MTSPVRTLLVLVALGAAACSTAEPPAPADRVPAQPRSAPNTPDAAAAPRIVILGDSLTAGFGLEKAQAFPSLLQQRLDKAGYRYEVVNAGVSGDTTAGGLRRLEWSIAGDTRILVVALGGNDGLRGLPVSDTKRNLNEIITRARQRDIKVILAGMEAPPNYGADYTTSFRQLFHDLANEHDITLVPFLLEGVAGVPALNIADGIHPNLDGARIVERTIWRAVEPLVQGSATR